MVVTLCILGILSIIGGITGAQAAGGTYVELQRQLTDPLFRSFTNPDPPAEVIIPWLIGGAISAFLWFTLAHIIANQTHALKQREAILAHLSGTQNEDVATVS